MSAFSQECLKYMAGVFLPGEPGEMSVFLALLSVRNEFSTLSAIRRLSRLTEIQKKKKIRANQINHGGW